MTVPQTIVACPNSQSTAMTAVGVLRELIGDLLRRQGRRVAEIVVASPAVSDVKLVRHYRRRTHRLFHCHAALPLAAARMRHDWYAIYCSLEILQ